MAPTVPTTTASSSANLWIAGPWIDLVVGCGAWSLPVLAVAYGLNGTSGQTWAGVFYALALVTNYPHYMATIYRAYGRADRERHRVYTVHATVALLLLGAWAHVEPLLLTALFTAYVMWSPWHYSGQNYGLLMMFARRAGGEVSAFERRSIRAAFVASYVMLLTTFHEGPSSDPLVLSLGLSSSLTRTVGLVALAVYLVLGGLGITTVARRLGWRRAVAPVVLLVTQGLWFVAPIVLSWSTGLPAPQTRYSSGVLAVMHAAQYLWVTQYFARRDQGPAWVAPRYWAAVVLGGMALFVPTPWMASYAGGLDFTVSALVVTAVVNLHHFMIDGVVWKLRQARVARALTDTSHQATIAAPVVAMRTLRPAIVLAGTLLVALAGLDQTRYWLSLRVSDPASLIAAAALNPHDALVQGRVLQALIARGDDTGARAHLEALIDRVPDNVDALVNAGVLARRAGRNEEAVKYWQRALATRQGAGRVHLYVAETLDDLARPAEAARHYREYLEQVVRPPNGDRPEAETVASVVLKFGDALQRTGQMASARQQFELAAAIATRAGAHDLARAAQARVQLPTP